MNRKFLVKIRMDVLRGNMSRADRQEYTDAEIRQWLLDAGFEPHGNDNWAIDEADLGHLDPSEVSEIVPLDAE